MSSPYDEDFYKYKCGETTFASSLSSMRDGTRVMPCCEKGEEYTMKIEEGDYYVNRKGEKRGPMMPRLGWNTGEDGVVTIYAHLDDGKVFDLLDIFRRPMIERGGMSKSQAKAFQAFSAERICNAWNHDKTASQIALDHKIDPAMGEAGCLTEWGQGHNAACDQIAHEIGKSDWTTLKAVTE